MTGDKILITGSTGYIGQHLTRALLDSAKYEIAVVVRNTELSGELFGDEVRHCDCRSPSLSTDLKDFNPNIFIHLAAFSSSAFDKLAMSELIDSNISLLANIMHDLLEADLDLLINVGSFSEYDINYNLSPNYFYSSTKSAARVIINYFERRMKFRFVNAIPYTVYGNRNAGKAIDCIINSILNQNYVEMTHGEQTLDYIYINDVIDFFLKAVDNRAELQNGKDYHIGTNVGLTLREVCLIAESVSGGKANINWGAKDYRVDDIMYAVAPYHEIKEIDWRAATQIKEGLIAEFNWWNNA